MPIDTDFHSHVSRSSAYEMTKTAQAQGLRVLGLSEHIFQMREARPILGHLGPEGPLLSFADYVEGVHTAQQRLAFDARLGLEVDFIPAKNEEIQSLLQGYDWDFLIGSIHEVDGIYFEATANWSREEGEALWLRYFELLREAVSSGYFSLISHPERMRMQNPYLPATFDEELERLAAEATRRDVALEINGYDAKTYTNLVRRLARACALYSTPVSIGSDAHNPATIAQSHALSEEILREAEISKVRLWRGMAAEEYTI